MESCAGPGTARARPRPSGLARAAWTCFGTPLEVFGFYSVKATGRVPRRTGAEEPCCRMPMPTRAEGWPDN